MNICVCSAVASFIFIYSSSRRGDCTVTSRLAGLRITSSFIYNPLTALTVCVGVMEWSPNAQTGSPCYHGHFDFLESQEDRSLTISVGAFLHSFAPTLLFIWGNNRMSEYLLFMQVRSFIQRLHSQITNTVMWLNTNSSQDCCLGCSYSKINITYASFFYFLWKLM